MGLQVTPSQLPETSIVFSRYKDQVSKPVVSGGGQVNYEILGGGGKAPPGPLLLMPMTLDEMG